MAGDDASAIDVPVTERMVEAVPVEPPATVASPRDVAPAAKEATEAIRVPDLWRAIGEGLSLEAPPRFRAADPLKHYGYSRRYLAAASARAKPFLFHIYTEIERRGLPFELALVPLIESGYNNAARGASDTAGLWQFIPATGQRFGLARSAVYDGRHDPVAATTAALDYFEQLAGRFDGDWLLALAAYNCGERTVEQAIARNRHRARPTDVWSLDLPPSTRKYLRRILDVATLVRQPARHGIQLAVIPGKPYFDTVAITAAVDLRALARGSGLYQNEFEQLNAAYRGHVTLARQPNRVLVAHGHGERVLALAETLPAARPEAVPTATGGARYVVIAGDTLSKIAHRYGVALAALTRANGLGSSRLRIGQVLAVPDQGAAGNAGGVGGGEHVVRAGDSLWTIARRSGISPQALAGLNGIATTATLRPGQRLRLPGATASTGASAGNATAEVTHYEVQSGDSLWTIAKRFGVSLAKLTQWNQHAAGRSLRPGERLVVHLEPRDDARNKI